MFKKNIGTIILVVIILVVGVGGDVFFWQQMVRQNQRQQQNWQAKMDVFSAQLTQQQTDVAALHTHLTDLQTKLTQFIQGEQQSSTVQILNEVEYLLDVANLYLQINHDTGNAIKSLQLAQQHLQTLADASLLPLQQALASDLNTLNDAPKLDVADILLKLQTVAESINRLALTPEQFSSSPAETQAIPVSAPSPWYQRPLQALWIKLKNLWVVRHYNTIASPIPPSKQREWIRENIAFTLAQAQWAVLQQKTALYQHSLTQVHHWLTEQYPDNPELKQILLRLEELSAIDIAPSPPDINASLRAVQQALKELPAASKLETSVPSLPQQPSLPPTPQPDTHSPSAGVEI